MTSRTNTVTQKVKTVFGSMYIHIHYDTDGYPCGGWISDPGKEPDSQVSILVVELSTALNETLKLSNA